jgi:hypothetical protein
MRETRTRVNNSKPYNYEFLPGGHKPRTISLRVAICGSRFTSDLVAKQKGSGNYTNQP